jgi:hypothetical protein
MLSEVLLMSDVPPMSELLQKSKVLHCAKCC